MKYAALALTLSGALMLGPTLIDATESNPKSPQPKSGKTVPHQQGKGKPGTGPFDQHKYHPHGAKGSGKHSPEKPHTSKPAAPSTSH
jgi:hypothetical protein